MRKFTFSNPGLINIKHIEIIFFYQSWKHCKSQTALVLFKNGTQKEFVEITN